MLQSFDLLPTPAAPNSSSFERDKGKEITVQTANEYSNNYEHYVNGLAGYSKISGSMGGKISASMLKNLLQCAEPGEQFVYFRLGMDSGNPGVSSKIHLLFSNSAIGQSPSGTQKIYTNSGESFCPTQCN
ncbi:MAG: hypothetical protein H6605_05555 [Flavobacteriales bacterium]|nr:hypothetical protein [Flavobacteriales bacterium]